MAIPEFTTEELANETWRPVVGYEGRYSVSSIGRVRSEYHSRETNRGPIVLKLDTHKRYPKVRLSNGGRRVKASTIVVHRLVAEAFIGPRPKGYQINHKDGQKMNPRLDNLEYATRVDNMRHAFRLGLIVVPRGHSGGGTKGSQHHRAKLTEVQIKEIRRYHNQGVPIAALARLCCVSEMNIHKIIKRIGWKHVA